MGWEGGEEKRALRGIVHPVEMLRVEGARQTKAHHCWTSIVTESVELD